MSIQEESAARIIEKPKMNTKAEIAEVIRNSEKILILSHIRPDGDCLGSSGALMMGLRQMGKTVAAYNFSGVPEKLNFIPGVEEIKTEFPEWEPDLWLYVDSGGFDRVSPTFRPKGGVVINIDHHATNDMFGHYNWVDINATAVGEQMYDLLEELGLEITVDMATAIFTSLVTDSGSFKYPNTIPRTFEIAHQLTLIGAKASEICKALYESKSREEVELTRKVYDRLAYDCDGKVIYSTIMWADYEAVGGDRHEPEGLVGEIRAIEGVEMSILFHELPNGGLRAGFRGKGKVDVSAIAQHFGGGGHFNASGYYNEKVKFEEERDRILEFTRQRVKETLG